jgi:co-chaperonin GroES (HSP10)|tara:strand:+ start:954 stop:1244 length:291 start_codon:yes stop_codon:yes gene_type:complete
MVIWCTTKTRDMTPIGKYIVIQKINEEKKTKSGLLLSSEDVESFRYQKGQVVKPGTDVSVINEGDVIFYDKAAGHSMFIKDETFTIISERDVVVVL